MSELTLDMAIAGLKKMSLALRAEPKFKRHMKEQEELEAKAGGPLLIMVMGEFSSGKSTFINAILGKKVTAMDATPTTAVITRICYGDRDETIVHFKAGRTKPYDSQDFMRLTAETAADDEARSLRESMDYVEKRLNLPILKDVSIIDSPGLGAITASHEQTTRRFMGNADAIVWLMSILQPAKASEVHALEALDPRLKPFVLVNKIDQIDEEEDDLEELLDDVRQKLKDHVHSVHGISALRALEGNLAGDETEVGASNIGEFFDLMHDEVLPRREEYRMHTLVHETATLIRHCGATLKFWSEQMEPLRDLDYTVYTNEKATLKPCEEALAEFARLWKEYVYDKGQEAERQYFEGVLYQCGLLAPVDKARALECFRIAAQYGEAEAETAYASALEDAGRYPEAFAEYQKAAMQKNGEAAAGCARLTEKNHGPKKAQEWYRKAARWGFSEAYLHINYGNDAAARLNGLREAANQGIPEAQVELAELYRQGIGCVRDLADVFRWQLEAARQGLKSQFLPVAQAYRDGTAVAEDAVQEFYWLSRAADYGDAESTLDVAMCFMNGHGVEQDRVETFIRLKRLSGGNVPESVSKRAAEALDTFFEHGTPEDQILIGDAVFNGRFQEIYGANSLMEAAGWYGRAEAQGSSEGSYRKAICLWRVYQEKDPDPKILYDVYISLKKAAQAGHGAANQFLQTTIETGTPELHYTLAQVLQQNGQDAKDVFHWYLKAAEGGYAPAFTMVGELYASGDGCAKDWSQAHSWLKKAKQEDGERGRNAYDEFMHPVYRKIKMATGAVGMVLFTVALWMGHEYLMTKPYYYRIIHGDESRADLSLGRLELGDAIEKMRYVLGEEMSRRQDGEYEFYIYPSIEVVFRKGRIESLLSKDDSVATSQGIHGGSTFQEVIDNYGKPTFVTDYDNLKLYEYKFNGFDSRYGLLRFAVDTSTQLVDYISVRIPQEETDRIRREAEEKRKAEERAKREAEEKRLAEERARKEAEKKRQERERAEKERKEKEARETAEKESKNKAVQYASEAAEVVKGFHDSITRKEYRAAYNSCTDEMQRKLGAYENWASGFRTTLESVATDFSYTTADRDRAELFFTLTARDWTPIGPKTRKWNSHVVLIKENGKWKIDAIENSPK